MEISYLPRYVGRSSLASAQFFDHYEALTIVDNRTRKSHCAPRTIFESRIEELRSETEILIVDRHHFSASADFGLEVFGIEPSRYSCWSDEKAPVADDSLFVDLPSCLLDGYRNHCPMVSYSYRLFRRPPLIFVRTCLGSLYGPVLVISQPIPLLQMAGTAPIQLH